MDCSFMDSISLIESLIRECEGWLLQHKDSRHYIDAAACSIRLAALRDCLAIVKKNSLKTA